MLLLFCLVCLFLCLLIGHSKNKFVGQLFLFILLDFCLVCLFLYFFSVSLFVCLFVCLLACLLACLLVCLFVCLFVCFLFG